MAIVEQQPAEPSHPNLARLTDQTFLLPGWARSTHAYTVGGTGTGKSRFLAAQFLQDVAAGRGAALFDTDGSLFLFVLRYLARMVLTVQGLAERIAIVDAASALWTIVFNALDPIPGLPPERQAAMLVDIVVQIWRIEPGELNRTLRVLHFTLLALILLRRSLLDVRRFLLDEEWRGQLLPEIQNPEVRSYFENEFPSSRAAQLQYVNPIIIRLDRLNLDPDWKLVLARRSTINFRELLDKQCVLLVNLSRRQLPGGQGNLFAALFLAHLQRAALARGEDSSQPPYFLYLDEFADYTCTSLLSDILSAMRKYKLVLHMAHQSLAQLQNDMLDAVLNNAGTLSAFRVGYRDATLLARELFPAGSVSREVPELRYLRLGPFPLPYSGRRSEPIEHLDAVALLTQLGHREFVLKVRGPYPAQKLRTVNIPALPASDKLLRAEEDLRCWSGQRYGRLKAEVRAELETEETSWSYVVAQPESLSYYEPIETPPL